MSTRHLALVWWHALATNTGRYAVFALGVWLLLWVVLGRPLSRRKIREESPRFAQMALEFVVSVRSIAVFATSAIAMSLIARGGGYRLSEQSEGWGPFWFVFSLALMVLGHDAFYYWTHRAMHRSRGWRGVHARHHRSRNPSPFTAYCFSLGEAALMALFVVAWPLVVPTPFLVVPIFMIHQIAKNTLAHCGYELMPARVDGRPLLDWLTTTTHHDLHHAQPGSNFGLYFTFWDRWCGTENPDYHAHFARAVRRPLATSRGEAPAAA